VIIAFSYPPGEHAEQLLRELPRVLGCHELLPWPGQSPAPAQNIQILLTLGAMGGERFEAQKHLELIQTLSAGYELVDVQAADELGIWVANAPAGETGNAASVAEFAVMLLIASSRRLTAALRADSKGIPLVGGENRALSGKTVCILGLGSVGRNLVDRLRPFGMTITATDHDVKKPPAGVRVYLGQELKTAVAGADYVVVCVPGSKANENLIDASVLGAMKRGAILINVARGNVVNETDLCAALQSGQIAAVGLDVLRHEPPNPADPLFAFPQALITPHIAGDTDLSLDGTLRFIGELLSNWSRGQKPTSIVNKPRKPRKAFAPADAPRALALSP
jgi:phosphoglycerate dehydrogenase-like enzyme